MLKFDRNGYLAPAGPIESTVEMLQSQFVEDIASRIRESMFTSYMNYSNSIKRMYGESFEQWINGSFCTKKSEPNDIDIVSFIPHFIVDAHEKEFSQFSFPKSLTDHGVDGYIVKVYPINDINYVKYQSDKLYWLHLFSKTRKNRLGKQTQKGFLQINF